MIPTSPRRDMSSGPSQFLKTAVAAFESAQRSAGPIDHHYEIAGVSVRVRFAGSALADRLSPALAHLRQTVPGEPASTICAWDSLSTETAALTPPWSTDDYGVSGEIHGYNDDRFRTVFNMGSGVLSMLDSVGKSGVYWVRDAAQLPYYESGAPLLTVLHWIMRCAGRSLVHAAAVGTESGGVLLVGKGGSGKSSTAAACISAGLKYAGDDYCMIAAEPSPYVHSLYSSGKVNGPDAERFPAIRAALTNANALETEKALYFLHGLFPERIIRGFPLRAVLVPRVTGQRDTRLVPVTPGMGLLSLAPSTLFQLPGKSPQAWAEISGIVKQVPCYGLELGTDREQIPRVILGLLDRGG
jgi:hypothetical protein